MEEYRFKVNLGGLIELLSDNLYSSQDVYIRELLQNGVDAITAREKCDVDFKGNGELHIHVDSGNSLTFTDNGVGLTESEIHQFLAIIGESSKKDLYSEEIQNDFIGRFGIGLLSCFMVSDEICLRTRSVKEPASYEWIGRRDGTYTLRKTEMDIPIGTSIYLKAKENCEVYFETEKVESLLLHYGLLLPYPILVDDGMNRKRTNPTIAPWAAASGNRDEIMMFGQLMFQTSFLDCIPLHSKTGGVDGVAYILPYSVQASTKQEHLIYLKNMFLTGRGDHILPDWAFFTKCVLNANDLNPNASREDFYMDDVLLQTRDELGTCISEYLKNMARHDKSMFRRFLDIHGIVVRSMAVDDDELFELFIDELDFETTRGYMTGLELRMSNETLLYCNRDEYKQISQVFIAQGILLINTSYIYSLELLEKMEEYYGVTIQRVDSYEIEERLKDIPLEEAEKSVGFLKIAEEVLKPYGCSVEMKQYIPANLPVFYYLNENAVLRRDLNNAKEMAYDLFSDLLNRFEEELGDDANAMLYFNMRNPLVKKMVEMEDEDRIRDIVVILYVQSLLLGGYTLRNNELGIMNEKLLKILEDI